ncbi:OmpA-OmpF porin, OOP family [Novimethylophilus kurashikiensis]|uniref:OmpA-OmpF porin, OOP family n=1 Tax=Novimethylophilus kurashikiensis TaxID=1825523 RepID=A0A2R5FJM0_9PROT|nr:OmpA family protein [Novimethylophilus kurashikiensis]GBG15924.1 OmpA-OmpF porin, OOP family [Novimethylophilus kurashikiensis]
MKTKLISVALAGMLGVAANGAFADDAFEGPMYIMPTLGYMHTDSDLKADNDVAYGIRLGKAISEHWDVQLGLTHSKADADNHIGGQAASGDYKQTLLGLDALYMFSRDKFRPFVLAGVGAAHNNIDYKIGGVNVGDSKTSWMANVGAGFQYLFTDNIGLQADIRHVWSRAKADNTVLWNGTETIGNTYLNVGVIFNFGAPKKVAAAEPEPTPAPAMEEIAPQEEEAVPPLTSEEPPQPDQGPNEPAFTKMTLQAEVLFGFDKDALTTEGKKILDTEVVEKMKAHPEVELVLITGHTDFIGDEKYNQKLSERRANSVKKYLVSQGIDANRLHAVGKGESSPVVDCKGVRGKKLIQCLQPNRRVVVEIEAQRQTAQ